MRRFWALLPLLPLFVLLACPKPPPPPPPDDEFKVNPNNNPSSGGAPLTGEAKKKSDEGAQAFSEGRYEEAAKLFEEAVQLAPKNHLVCYYLGEAYMALNRLEDAAKTFEEATRRKPNFAEAYNSLGYVQMELDQLEQGIVNIEKALQINPNYFEALYNLGEAYLTMENLDKAKECYLKAAKINPQDADTQASLAGISLLQKDFQSAKQYAARSVELSNGDPQLILLYGRVLEESGDLEGAEKMYLKGISIAEKTADKDEIALEVATQGHFSLGSLKLSKGDLAGAEDAFRKWVKLVPKSASAHSSLASVLKKAKKYKESEVEYQEALKLKPGAIPTTVGLGELYLEQKKCAEAKKTLNPVLPQIEDQEKSAELLKRIAACK